MPPLNIGCWLAVLFDDFVRFVGILPLVFFICHYSSEVLTKNLLPVLNREMKEAYCSLFSYVPPWLVVFKEWRITCFSLDCWYFPLGCPRNSADTEFRGIFWLLKWFLRNSGAIPQNCTGNHFRIPRNAKMSLPWTPYFPCVWTGD